MSYRRSFTKTISVHYSGTATTSVSVNGTSHTVSVPYSGTAYENVTVNIDVDTTPFDTSVGRCNGNVDLLTGAVVATEGAQVASIRENSKKVADTVINGFFKTVRSEISQQITELKSRIDATILHLNELAKRCIEKQRQMETDYNRISSRYSKIFADLDSELSNRIYELDKPAFVFRDGSDVCMSSLLGSDLVGTVAVSGTEQSRLGAKISASLAKRHALDAINRADTFLEKQYATDSVIRKCIRNDAGNATYYAPVCYIETEANESGHEKKLFQPEDVPQLDHQYIIEAVNAENTHRPDKTVVSQICNEFNAEVSNRYATADEHGNRVRDYINRLFNINSIQLF